MNAYETVLCVASVGCSVSSQLSIKAATLSAPRPRQAVLLLSAVALQLASVLLVVQALQTLPLSLLVPFAALAYLAVPLLATILFKERLLPRFWVGAAMVFAGVACMGLYR
ncbi:hypothetical protein JR065_08430 [Xanthomonas sp. AmX2]|uniref:EamA family transporter n=1 Tax=Xanthomonas sp. TaxID=29446 RepID=UPI00197E5AF5|nr:hypothetical protein [Xanthomonas sp.]